MVCKGTITSHSTDSNNQEFCNLTPNPYYLCKEILFSSHKVLYLSKKQKIHENFHPDSASFC